MTSEGSPPPDRRSPFASAPPSEPTLRAVTLSAPPSADYSAFEARYGIEEVLGHGGMGDVFAAKDARIGRAVALKAARSVGPDEVARFDRECRLQGQLEHPGVVPVYDVGTMPDGAPFFTMKRVRGVSLEDVLKRLAEGERVARARYTRARLLVVFTALCQTIHYAHRRGVIHRDLKPANVMLGDFGEVYVIDWGIAKVGEHSPRASLPAPPVNVEKDGTTQRGLLLGTLGYMAPEQLEDATSVGPQADVYSLGTILFELLTLERLHPGDRAVDLAAATMRSVEPRVRSVARDAELPLELEEACVAATRLDPAERLASVDDLLAIIQRYLDGDRNVEARAALADQEARLALRALEGVQARALAREVALAHAGRALTLSPSHGLAREVVFRLMLDEPAEDEEPDVAKRDVERLALRIYRGGAGVGALLYGTWFPFIAYLAVSGPKQTAPLVAWAVLDALAIGGLYLCSRADERRAPLQLVTLALCLAATDSAALVVGPFLMVPGVVTVTTVIFMMLGKREWHAATIAVGFVGLCTPLALEQAEWLARTTTFGEGILRVDSPVVSLHPLASMAALLAGMIMFFVVLCATAVYFHKLLGHHARKNVLYAWKLAALAPRGVLEGQPVSSARRGEER